MFAQGADGFWRYAAERQRIFEARHRTQIESLEETEEEREKIQSYRTRDKILRKFHFTNIYRFTDRGAQYMIQKVIRGAEKTTEDVLFRIFLYQMFNRESTWEAIEDAFGQVTIQRFTMNDFNEPLIELAEAKKPVYTNAYVTFGNKGGYKYNFEKHVALARKLLENRTLESLENLTMKQMYQSFLKLEFIGPFLAYQLCIATTYIKDRNYSVNNFVKLGNGSKLGIRRMFTAEYAYGKTELDLVMDLVNAAEEKLPEDFYKPFGLQLNAIDIEHTLCEYEKYARVVDPETAVRKTRRLYYDNKPKFEIVNPY